LKLSLSSFKIDFLKKLFKRNTNPIRDEEQNLIGENDKEEE